MAEIARFLGSTDLDVYLVGGAVRDLMLGRAVADVDLAVDGDLGALVATFDPSNGAQTRFGTVSVMRAGHRYDFARTRRERYPHPGALPEVEPAGIGADLARRDFSVNAIALGLSGARTGDLLAAPGALEDLRTGRLSVLHDRSFIDDPTRLLRLARYAARLGFAPDPHTQELAAEAIASDALGTISGTRIGNELRLLATEPDPVVAFEAAADIGLPWTIDPALARAALEALPADGRADLLVLTCVLGQDEQLAGELDRLGFSAPDRDTIVEGAGAAVLAQRLADAHTRSEIARTVGTAAIETVALAYGQGSRAQSSTWLHDLRRRTLEITGRDLIANGVPEGPRIGAALQAARDALMDGDATDRESQLRVALRAAE